jgi:topoisomerase-4 subunit A
MSDFLKPTDQNFNTSEEETTVRITGMYKEWFLDYASYVILERAVPAIADGFKPVQRRILHSMKDLDDGRYNKVANVVGHTMQYHPHGDASIKDAMVQIGQKDLLIDTQGNWGNTFTGDGAAAARYIEARLSTFALEVAFNSKTTSWQASYDGRKKEPVSLPVKFPMLLVQGAEGIAVGLSTKILPHNFNELIDASINCLKGEEFTLYPDFSSAGVADFSNYKDGIRGGKVIVRAKIGILDKKTLVISEIPFGTNTNIVIDSILKANEKGKIKIRQIDDNTAAKVEILVHLPAGVSPDKTIDALYAFTICENTISPLCCVIADHKPCFIGVSDILRDSTKHTVYLLKRELEIKLSELEEQWHFSNLERLFIVHKIYRNIEQEETWKGVINAIRIGLEPYIAHLKKDINEDDIVRLTEIKIKKISRFDISKAEEFIQNIEAQIQETQYHLENLTSYAISYFLNLKKKYGKGKERKTKSGVFEDIVATKVVMRTSKLYVNREEGFIGTSLKKDEYVCDCADIDEVIVFRKDGSMLVAKVEAKAFIGKDIIYASVFKKDDSRTVYNMVYRDGAQGSYFMKRFHVKGITRDRVYDLTNQSKGSLVVYFSANPNGEAETITIHLNKSSSLRKLKWDVDFTELAIKGRAVKGNLVAKTAVKKIVLKTSGVSTLAPRKIWFDEVVSKLNTEGRGKLLGEFKPEDKLLVIRKNGSLMVLSPELSIHFEEDTTVVEKWVKEKPVSAIYFEGEKERFFIKRFLIDGIDKKINFITDHPKSKLQLVSTDFKPRVSVEFIKKSLKNYTINIEEFIPIKGIKAIGNQLSSEKIKHLELMDSLSYEPLELLTEDVEDTEGQAKEGDQLRLF